MNELTSENPKMPRKFRPAKIENEPIQELKIREKISLEKFKLETELLHTRSKRFETEFKRIDDEVITFLKAKSPQGNLEKCTIEWAEKCKKETEKSIHIFKKQEKWLKDNLTTDF